MEQIAYIAMWSVAWLIGGWILFRVLSTCVVRMVVYSEGLRAVIDITSSQRDRVHLQTITDLVSGTDRVRRSYIHLSRWVIPSLITSLLLWVGLVIRYVFTLDFGSGYGWATAVITVVGLGFGVEYLSSKRAILNTLWGLEVLRSTTHADRARLQNLLDEAVSLEVSTHPLVKIAVDAGILDIEHRIKQVDVIIEQTNSKINHVKKVINS